MKPLLFFFIFLISTAIFGQNLKVLNPKPSFLPAKEVAFANASKGFIINDKQLLSTDDGGLNWNIKQKIEKSRHIYFSGSTGFIYGNNGYLLESKDFGETWVQSNLFEAKDIIQMKIYNDKIYTAKQDSIIITDLNFENKSRVSIPLGVSKLEILDENVWLMGTDFGSIYKTIDGGNSWTSKFNADFAPAGVNVLYFKNNLVGFMSRDHGDFFKTSDGGENWIQDPYFSRELYDLKFLDENTGFASGEGNIIVKTIDGGNTWTYIGGTSYGDTDLYGIYFNSVNEGFTVGQRGRILKTTNGGTTWNEYAPFYNTITNFQFVGANSIVALIDNNTYYKSPDKGLTWTKVASPGHYQYTRNFFFFNELIGYSLGGGTSEGSSLFKTTDGGTSWFKQGTTNYDFTGNLHFFTPDYGIIAGENGTLETTNGGNSWVKVNNTSLSKVQFINDTIGYAFSFGYYSYGKLYRTNDAGKNWTPVLTDTSNDLQYFNFVNKDLGYVISRNIAKKTTDGGVTWTNLNIPNGGYNYVKFYNDQLGFIYDDFNHFTYKTQNGGETWQILEDLNEIYDINFSGDHIYFGGEYGKLLSVKAEDLILKTADITTNDNDGNTVFPNPATNKIFVQSKVGKSDYYNLFNMNGQFLKKGSLLTTNEIDLKYPVGIYFIHISTKGKVSTKKIIIK